MKRKFIMWVLSALSLILLFGLPAYGIIELFSEDVETSYGGYFFYLVSLFFIIILIRKINHIIKEQKAGTFKTILKLIMRTFYAAVLLTVFRYVHINMALLTQLVGFMILGSFGSSVLEYIVISIDEEYAKTMGVF